MGRRVYVVTTCTSTHRIGRGYKYTPNPKIPHFNSFFLFLPLNSLFFFHGSLSLFLFLSLFFFVPAIENTHKTQYINSNSKLSDYFLFEKEPDSVRVLNGDFVTDLVMSEAALMRLETWPMLKGFVWLLVQFRFLCCGVVRCGFVSSGSFLIVWCLGRLIAGCDWGSGCLVRFTGCRGCVFYAYEC